MMKECTKHRIKKAGKKESIPCPLCEYSFFDVTMRNKHLLRRHTKNEIEIYLENQKNQNVNKFNIEVQWIGKYRIVPPLPSPIPLNICYNHVPPHPKCQKCMESFQKCPLFPPIRFYKSAFVQFDDDNDGNAIVVSATEFACSFDHNDVVDVQSTRKFHFNIETSDFGVILEDTRIAKVEALCEDRFKRYFIGIKFYYSLEEFDIFLMKNGKCNNRLKHSLSTLRNSKMNEEDSRNNDELILDSSSVHWIEMTQVKGRCYILQCDESSFNQTKMNMGITNDDNVNDIKFYHLQWLGNSLEELNNGC